MLPSIPFCHYIIFKSSYVLGDIYGLIDGSLVSDCRLPCSTFKTHTKFLNEYKSDETLIDISFSSKVKVTKTDLMEPTLSGFLSEVQLKIIKLLYDLNYDLIQSKNDFKRWAVPWAFGLA